MFKKTVTYEDYNGTTQTEDFYFNLTKVECLELEYSFAPGASLSGSIQTLINAKDMGTVVSTIKTILLKAYGVKSPDGKRFVKNEAVREEFEQNPAFEQIYWEFVTDPEKTAEFIAGIVPSGIRENLGDNPKETLLKQMTESVNSTE